MRCSQGLFLVLCFGVADAHPTPFSFLDVHLDADGNHGTLTLHEYDVASALGLPQAGELQDVKVVLQHYASLTGMIDQRLQFMFDQQAVRPEWRMPEVLAEQDSLLLSFQLPDERPGELDIVGQLFAYDPQHQTFVNVYESGVLKQQAILDTSHTGMKYYAGNLQGHWSVVSAYLTAGVQHILAGPDHILFLFGLLLLGGTVCRLLTIVTSFTIGHSITLTLAVLDVTRLPPAIVEPAIALSIVVVGADNLLVRKQRAADVNPGSKNMTDLRPWLAATFGLIHGFGFASVLQEFGLPREALAWSLAAFNVGVEIGQMAIVLAVTGALFGLRRYSTQLADFCAVIGSAAVVATGCFWFGQRVFFSG